MDKRTEQIERIATNFGLYESEWEKLDEMCAEKQWSRATLIMNLVRDGIERWSK